LRDEVLPAGGRTTPASIREVASASLIGSVVEWYDFFLYSTMAILVFNTEFFPTMEPVTGTIAAFATFAAGFATRPLGGVVFGHLGDRLGRKRMLVVTMMVMGLATFAIGLLPTYDTLGVAAPVLLVLLRMLQGIGLGGEWGGAVLLCVEHAPQPHRGWYASWPQLGVPIALLLSIGSVQALTLLGEEALVGYAWRIPFLSSIVLVAIGLFLRLRVDEPPAFRELVRDEDRARMPLVEVVRRHPRVTLLAMGARLSESVTFNVYNAFLVTYVVSVLDLSDTLALNALLVAAVVGFAVILAAAAVSDRIGRRPVFATGALLALVTAFPVWALIDTGSPVLVTIAVVVGWGLAACTMFGPEGVFFAELYPTRVRYSGMSTVYQLGVLPSGAVAPLVCTWLVTAADGASWPAAVYVMAMAAITLLSLWFLPETHRRGLHAHGHETIDSSGETASREILEDAPL
jgi:MHS family shikimate/dehydroshikimate transporter-like MFS transporter